MQLICIGDIANTQKQSTQQKWAPPGGLPLNDEVRVLFNMELPLGGVVNPKLRTSGPRLLTDPELLQKIKGWSPGFAALATNHMLDSGEDGLKQTIDLLQQAGFESFGAGSTLEQITKPLIWHTKEGCLAVINWVFPETHPDWMLIPGPNCWPGAEAAERTIQDLKSQTDWVMVFAHWSDECFPYPRPEDRIMARSLVRMGADVVVAHHPHVVRGMELIGTCPVFYSIGNYFFSDHPDANGGWIVRQAPRNRESLGILLSLQRGMKPEYQILSFWSSRGQTILDPIRRAARRFESVSRPLKQLDENQYREWYKMQRRRFDRWGYRWHFGIWSLGIRGVKRRVMRLFKPF